MSYEPPPGDTASAGKQDGPRLSEDEVGRRVLRRAAAYGVPLPTILVVAAVGVVVYLGGKLLYTIRDVVFLFLTASFIAVLIDPLVVAVQGRVKRRGIAVAIVTLWAVIVFAGLAVLFGYPLLTGLTRFAADLPRYVASAQHGRGFVGHLIRRYHLVSWFQKNLPKFETFIHDLAGPAVRVGKGAVALVVEIGLVIALVLLLLLEAPKMRTALLESLPQERAEHLKQLGNEVSSSLSGFLVGDLITSVIAGVVIFITLELLGVPYPALWATWVGLVDFLPEVGGALAGIPTVCFALDPLALRRCRHGSRLPRVHHDREPPPQPGRDEPHRQDQPAARLHGCARRRGLRRHHRRAVQRLRCRPPRHTDRCRPADRRP